MTPFRTDRSPCLDPLWDRRQRRALLAVLAVGALLRFTAAAAYYNYFDLGPYNIPWAIYAAEDRFGMYNNPVMAEFQLDYPPIFPFLISFFGPVIRWAHDSHVWPVEMFFVKLMPVLADLALVALVWLIAADHRLKEPWKPALFWALNPAPLYNCAFWGQADCFLLFFLLAMVWALERRQPELAAVIFAFGCLTKLQMCYFAPVLLLGFLLGRLRPLRWLSALCLGGGVGLLGWYPFMRRGEWFRLPLRIYLGGYGKYNYVDVRGANLYAFGDHYMQPDSDIWFGGVTFYQVSALATALAFFWLLFCAVRAVRRKPLPPLCVIALVYMEILFLFTTRQHERYQLPVLALALFWWLQGQSRAAAFFTISFSAITFVNQFYVVAADNHPALAPFCRVLEDPLAAFNLLLFPLLCAAAALYFRGSPQQAPQRAEEKGGE